MKRVKAKGKKSKRRKLIRTDSDWEMYEDVYLDNYRMYMYFVLGLGFSTSMMSAFYPMWQHRKMFFCTLDILLTNHGWFNVSTSIPWNLHDFKDEKEVQCTLIGKVTKMDDAEEFRFINHTLHIIYHWKENCTIEKEGKKIVVSENEFTRTILKEVE